MSKMIATFAALLVTAVALGTGPSTASATTVYDLTADWSNVNNPNGVWSYNEGANPLPFLPNWGSGIGVSWGRNQERTNPWVPVWYMSTGAETFGNDIQAGDVVVHTTDNSGSGQGPANVTWTATFDGIVDITGHVYMGRDIGRGNRWGLSLNTR
ncbi:MAG: hypothetical protein CMJ49_10095 [Planctomycetaceae bacterium]|nr:hypothetical protein [Planctomycetaceae bacterium]